MSSRTQSSRLALRPQRRAAVGRAAALAEQALEDDARMGLSRKRRRRRRPREIVLIDARVAVVALTDRLEQIHRQLQRRQQRLVADLLRGNLIDRRAQVVVGAFGPFRLGRAEERGVGGRMRAGVGVLQLQVRDDRELIDDRGAATGASAKARSACRRPAASSGRGRIPSACRRIPGGAPARPAFWRGRSSTEPWHRAAAAPRSRPYPAGTSGAAVPSW